MNFRPRRKPALHLRTICVHVSSKTAPAAWKNASWELCHECAGIEGGRALLSLGVKFLEVLDPKAARGVNKILRGLAMASAKARAKAAAAAVAGEFEKGIRG